MHHFESTAAIYRPPAPFKSPALPSVFNRTVSERLFTRLLFTNAGLKG
jgi:hypothetical protein